MWIGFVVGALSIPVAILLGARWASARRGRAVLVATVVMSGAVLMVCGLAIAVVVVVGHRPVGDEREIYLLGLCATVVGCALVVPVRARLRRWANRVVPGDRKSPEDLLAEFGTRLTRSVPMDELLLQVVEMLDATLALSAAEIWVRDQSVLVRRTSMPEREPAQVPLDPDAHHVAARAQAQGNTWLEMWIPELVDGRGEVMLRSVSIRHRGVLLGLILLERPAHGEPFTLDEDRILTDLARQLGLALHNLRLDSALRASVEELEERNDELAASRARVVAVADESRRHIERDLHDGAQQHLVALAVKVGLIRSTLDTDPQDAADMIEELTVDVGAAIEALRDLAHGIYPPRLRDRGLAEALRAAAARSPRPTTVDASTAERYAPDVEAAVYFCCLEAIHNAAKYAGDDATIAVELRDFDGSLHFTVSDDGSGFEIDRVSTGHGVDNMRDRLAAIGGEFTMDSSPNQGTVVSGRIPCASPTPHAASSG